MNVMVQLGTMIAGVDDGYDDARLDQEHRGGATTAARSLMSSRSVFCYAAACAGGAQPFDDGCSAVHSRR